MGKAPRARIRRNGGSRKKPAAESFSLRTSHRAGRTPEMKLQLTIEAEFEAARRKCNSFGGNAGDVCLAEARGDHRVAMAELEERRSPSFKTRYKLHIAKAETEFEIATEECDERINGAKDECLAEA